MSVGEGWEGGEEKRDAKGGEKRACLPIIRFKPARRKTKRLFSRAGWMETRETRTPRRSNRCRVRIQDILSRDDRVAGVDVSE